MFSIVHPIGSTACPLEPAKFRGAPPLCCGRRPRDRSLIGLNDARDDSKELLLMDGRIPENASGEIGYLLGMSARTPKYRVLKRNATRKREGN